MNSFVFLNRAGCFLPTLIILNLFFGRLIFKPLEWLAVGLALVLLFLLNSTLAARKIFSGTASRRDSRVIDVEAEVMEEDKQAKVSHRKS